MGGFGSGMGVMWLFWLLLILGIVLLAILAVRAFFGGMGRKRTGQGEGGKPDSPGPGSTARQILDERYARGGLSTEEYTERLKALGDGDR